MHVYVCMYIYVCICMYVYVCVYVRVYMYVCMYVCMCMCVYAYMYMYVCIIYWGDCPGWEMSYPKREGNCPGESPPDNSPVQTRQIPPVPLKTQLENDIYTYMYAHIHTYIHICI